jgi:tetratricopeptide (TPR) repeat protein
MRDFISKQMLLLVLIMGQTSCSIDSDTPPESITHSNNSARVSQQVYNALLGEMYSYYGDINKSLFHYMQVIENNDSPDVAKRITKLAARSNDNESAMQAVRQWVSLDPESVDAHQFLALLNIRMNNPHAAAKELLWVYHYLDKKNKNGFAFVASLVGFEANKEVAYQAFKLFAQKSKNPNEASLALAALAINSGNYKEVISVVKRPMESSKIRVRNRAALFYAKAMMHLKQEKEAIKRLKPLIRHSENADLKLEYARLLVLDKQYERANVLFKKLYKQYPNNADILYTLGLLYLDMQRFDEAQPLFERLSQMPNRGKSDESHYFLGQIYQAQKQNQKAILAYTRAEDTLFNDEAESSIAKLLFKTKGLAKARGYLQTRMAKTVAPAKILMLRLMDGQLLYNAKHYQEALLIYKTILDSRPDNFDGLYSRSLTYTQMGDIKNAEQDLKKILQKTPNNVTALNALGYSLACHTTRFDEAKGFITQALKLNPDDPAILDSMGWVEYRIGNYNEAESLLKQAYSSLQDPEIASHLIEILSQNKKDTEARGILKEMLDKFPNDERLKTLQEKIYQLGTSN